MSTNRAAKAAVRAARLPGENYTSARRRIVGAPLWRCSGIGLGTVEYTATVDDVEWEVAFLGEGGPDNPLTGWWFATGERASGAPLEVNGRVRLPSGAPSDAQMTAVLASLVPGLQAAAAGVSGDELDALLVDAGHGGPLTYADVQVGTVVFVQFDAAGGGAWDVSYVEDVFGPDAGPDAWLVRLHSDDGQLPELRFDAAAGTWTTDAGTPVAVYAP